jgi:hypothetical protein
MREGERKERGGAWISVRHGTLRRRGGAEIFLALKTARRCPHALLVKEISREGKALESKGSESMNVGWFRLRTKKRIRECSLPRSIGILILIL